MNLREWFRPPRHLLVMFCGITFVSAATLGWLGWQLVRQDRALASQRSQERRENAADLAVASLEQQLSEVEEQLTALADLPANDLRERALAYSQRLGGDAALLIFHADRIDAYPPAALVYYPVLPRLDEAVGDAFAEADAIEFREGDHARAIAVLEDLAGSTDPWLHSGALVRLGRNFRKAGRWADATATYEDLAQLGDVPVGGLPADLLAESALAALLEERDEHERLSRAAARLYHDLHNGRWRLTRAVYDSYVEQTARWLGSDVPTFSESSAWVLTEATESLWHAWQRNEGVHGRQTFWGADQSLLLLGRRSSDRMVVLGARAGYLESHVLAPFRPVAESLGVQIALSDAAGRPVVGSSAAPDGQQSLRLGAETGLPWTLSAVSVQDPADAALTARIQFVIVGLFAIASLVLGGGYLIGRAVVRELAVARLQSDFVAAVSHEFRTPLTALRQLAELLSKGRVNSEEVRQQYYEVLEHESARLQRLVEGLLKFGRMEAGVIRFQFEQIDLAEFLESLAGEFGPEAKRYGCHIELNVPDAVPPVRVDREALSYVIWNLLDNAVKYSPDSPSVWVDLVEEHASVAIRVRDQGVGIPKGDQGRIFQKFVRGESATQLGVPGTGIGLAVAQQIMARHNGDIRVDSEPGTGSTFTVVLPVATST